MESIGKQTVKSECKYFLVKLFINRALHFNNAAKEKYIQIQVILVKGEDMNASKYELDIKFSDAFLILKSTLFF